MAPEVWCLTTDPEVPAKFCSVPFCPPLKALDFSLDNDWETDENYSYTYAILKKKHLPLSFTICSAFMVEAWAGAESANSVLFALYYDGDSGQIWHWVRIIAKMTYTEFSFRFEDSPMFSNQSKILFFPLQWTRVCFSKDTNSSLARLVVDGELVIEQEVKVKNQPENLDLVLGFGGIGQEYPGQTTDLNIFSLALTLD